MVPVAERNERTNVRTCVGCKKAAGRDGLVRVVRAPDGAVAVDHPPRLGGRGAWLHAERTCIARAFERGGLARAFSAPVSGAPEDVALALERRLEDRTLGMIAGGRGGARIAVGTEAVREAISAGEAKRILVATDARGDRDTLVAAAARAGVAVAVLFDKARIGRAVGKEVVGVIAVLDGGLSTALGREMDRLQSLHAESPPGIISNRIEASR